MTTNRILLWLAGGLFGIALCAAPQLAGADEDEAAKVQRAQEQFYEKQQSQNQQSGEQAKVPEVKLQILELKHVQPQEIMQLLQVDGGVSSYGYRGAAFGFRAQRSKPNQLPIRIAADDETNTLFVRAPAERLKAIAELVKAFDAPPAEMPDSVDYAGAQVTPVRHADPQQVQNILQQLGLTARTLKLGEATLLVLTGEGEALEQARQVVAKLDEKSQAKKQAKKQRAKNEGAEAKQTEKAEGEPQTKRAEKSDKE